MYAKCMCSFTYVSWQKYPRHTTHLDEFYHRFSAIGVRCPMGTPLLCVCEKGTGTEVRWEAESTCKMYVFLLFGPPDGSSYSMPTCVV